MIHTIRLERMSSGPEAIGHLDSGKTVFVAGGVAGDEVELELFEEKSSFARGKLLCIKQASPLRVKGHCDRSVECGGCTWQNVSYPAQLQAKTSNVVNSLVRIAGLEQNRAEDLCRPCRACEQPWGYRNKLELGAAYSDQGQFLLGFHREGTHLLNLPGTCPLAHTAIAGAPKALRGALRFAQGSRNLDIFRVGIRHSERTGESEVALWTKPGPFPRAHVAKIIKNALNPTSIVRILSQPGKARSIKGVEVLDGKGFWTEQLTGVQFLTSAPSFFQVNTAQAETMVAVVLDMLKPCPISTKKSLAGLYLADLYAGGGTFSVALALQGARVVAVEAAGSSVRDLRRNAIVNGVDLEIRGGDAARELHNLGALDALVVDPPRAGLSESAVVQVCDSAPHKLVYISCNPSTWARDVARLKAQGYLLREAQPLDMFPQTHHVEVVSVFDAANQNKHVK